MHSDKIVNLETLIVKISEEVKILEDGLGISPVYYKHYIDLSGRITSLSLNDTDQEPFPKITGNILEFISAFQKLESLTIDISDYVIDDLSPISKLQNLREFTIVRNAKIENLSSLEKLKKLETLSISNSRIADMSSLSWVNSLKHLILENCDITDLSFLRGLKNLRTLNLNHNLISKIGALDTLTQIEYLYLKDNQIRDPFPVYKFHNLDILDLRKNEFGQHIYYRNGEDIESPHATFEELSEMIGNYYFDQGQYDEALAYCYIDTNKKKKLELYYERICNTPNLEDYHFEYYAINCLRIIQSSGFNTNDPEVMKIKEHLSELIINSRLVNRKVINDALINGRSYYYNDAQEHRSYIVYGKGAKHQPEMMYVIAGTLLKKKDLMKCLFLYKTLVELDSPFQYPLYDKINNVLQTKFNLSEELESDQIKDQLDNILQKRIPNFDYLNYNENLESYQNDTVHSSTITASSGLSVRTWIFIIIAAIRILYWLTR